MADRTAHLHNLRRSMARLRQRRRAGRHRDAARAHAPRPRAAPRAPGHHRRDGRSPTMSPSSRRQLADIESISLIPPELLHISVRGIGFQVIAKSQPNDVLRQEVGAIAEHAATRTEGRRADRRHDRPRERLPRRPHPAGPARRPDARAPAPPRRSARRPDAFPYIDRQLPPARHHRHLPRRHSRRSRPARAPARPPQHSEPLPARIDRIDFVRWWFTGHDLTAWPELDTIRTYK